MAENVPNNILFLRVGIDKGCGGTLGPVFADKRFEYIPIPESCDKASNRSTRFSDLKARSGGMLAQFVPSRYRQRTAHYDPEFETFTYGDPTVNKRRQLLKLSEGDYLVFYAGLTPNNFTGSDRLYLIGYFTVRQVYEIPNTGEWPPSEFLHLTNNAHLRRNAYDPGLVIVEGRHDRSRLLHKAVPFSDESQRVLPELISVVGYSGSVMRAIGRWVPPRNLEAVVAWLTSLE
jgi:hypothetical protein